MTDQDLRELIAELGRQMAESKLSVDRHLEETARRIRPSVGGAYTL